MVRCGRTYGIVELMEGNAEEIQKPIVDERNPPPFRAGPCISDDGIDGVQCIYAAGRKIQNPAP